MEVSANLCLNCGFVATSPRPEEIDLANKYAFLTQMAATPNLASTLPQIFQITRTARSRQIFEAVKNFQRKKNLEVLDYGGGNGSMLQPFLDDGDKCFVADYYDGQIPGVEKIANDWGDFPKERSFDVILCNHVLEHVCNPLEVIERLGSILKEGGVLFAEVPLEVWAGIPIEKEPVTHINFFTHETFQSMFKIATYTILDSRVQERTIMPSTIEVSWILAGNFTGGSSKISESSLSATRARLMPSRAKTIQRLWEIDLQPRIRNSLGGIVPLKKN